MKCSSANEWKIGDKGKTEDGQIVTIAKVVSSYLVIVEELEKKVYIPAHGEIEKV